MKNRRGIEKSARLGYHVGVGRSGARRARRCLTGYIAWLRALAALLRALCSRDAEPAGAAPGALSRRVVWRGPGVPEEIFAAFRGVAALPEELFGELAGEIGCCRVTAGDGGADGPIPRFALSDCTEDELRECMSFISAHTRRRVDWDAFMSACERSRARSEALMRLCRALQSGFPRRIDTGSLRSAAASVLRGADTEHTTPGEP